MDKCNVCNSEKIEIIYDSGDNKALASNNKSLDNSLKVFFCENCSHCITEQPQDMEAFYANDYKISLSSEDDDQLISVKGSDTHYRTEFQSMILEQRVNLKGCSKILDYGGAKSATVRRVVKKYSNLIPHIFDVSEDYAPFWDGLYDEDRRAVFSIPEAWSNKFDLVTSFFVLEHVEELRVAFENIYRVLKEGGELFFIVPNVYKNPADFLVADHVNHFSEQSISMLLNKRGFEIEVYDEETNPSWIIVVGKKNSNLINNTTYTQESVRQNKQLLSDIALLWKNASSSVGKILSDEGSKKESCAIYGAGFYGTFLAEIIGGDKFSCFVDQNKYLQDQGHLGKKVFSPSNVPSDITTVVVGLNPATACAAIESIEEWADKNLKIIYPFSHE